MTYEYEIKIPMWLEDGRWLNMNVDDEVLDELEEVYHKAEILNKIVNIIKNGRSLNSNIDFEIIVLAIEHELIYLEDE